MNEKALKVVAPAERKTESPPPDAKEKPGTESIPEAPGKESVRPRLSRQRLRMMLLVALPAMAVLGGLAFYLMGGRYISTDNAFVGAQKVLITPDVSGKIIHVAIVEGQHVKPGDELFTLDPVPYRLALRQAEAKLDTARTNYSKLKTTLASLTKLNKLAQKNVAIKRRDVARKNQLAQSQAGSRADVDTAAAGLVTAELQAQFAEQQRETTLSQLLDNPNLPLAQFPEYVLAKAAVDDAGRNLKHTVVRAPISGTATQVDNIELGRFIAAGTPVLSVIDDQHPWVDANPKETEVTYLRIGQKASIEVDSFPGRVFKGHVIAVSPGTGAQFSILPPQNATGNWIKVVQRLPVRIAFDEGQNTRHLRAGMSATVDIDTGHSRLPFFSASATENK